MTEATTKHDGQISPPGSIGVLLCNLGTPEAPTPKALRRYLREFLSDPRVVELSKFLWLPFLHGVILNTRPKRSAAAYAKVWTDAGSPLMAISKRQAAALAKRLKTEFGDQVCLELAMRYGRPSIAEKLRQLRQRGVQQLLIFPLYPQYAAATTASVFDAVSQELKSWRALPNLRFIADYHQDPLYIAALANSLEEHWQAQGRGGKLIMSFHGIPQQSTLAGDPYAAQCQATAARLAEKLGLTDEQWLITFQSRFGPKKWLQPYTDVTLKIIAEHTPNVDIICPGFSADCLETLEEIQMRYSDVFIAAGGQKLNYIPALNDRDDHLDMMMAIIKSNISGWPISTTIT